MLTLFEIKKNPLETFLMHRMQDVARGTRTREDIMAWLLDEGEVRGVVVVHQVIQTLSMHTVQMMLRFIAQGTEGQVFSCLMARDQNGNTIGHALFGQTQFDVNALVMEGLGEAYFLCLKKLAGDCRFDTLQAMQGEQTLQMMIEHMGQMNTKIQSDYAWSMDAADTVRPVLPASTRAIEPMASLTIETNVDAPFSGPPSLSNIKRHRKHLKPSADTQTAWKGPPF